MIDFHTHILPGIDDGSRDTAMTKTMLHMEKKQGVNHIVATPHFYASRASIDRFLEKRTRAYDKVCQRIYEEEKDLPDLRLGAEVYYFPGMGRADLSSLCIEGTNLILVEMPFAQWTNEMAEEISRIIKGQNLKVILAHLERFYRFQKKKDAWNRILAMPVIIQINAECMEGFFNRRFATSVIKGGAPVILGSDCHNTSTRPPNLDRGYELLQKKLGADACKDIQALGERLLIKYALEDE